MKIGIDASRAFMREKTGTEEYSYQLIKSLAGLSAEEAQFILYIRKGAAINIELPRNFSVREIGGNFLWTQIHLSLELLRRKVDVLFVPSHSVPIMHPQKTVVTVHGLEYKNCPQCYGRRDRLMLEINTRLAILLSKKIIAPSQSTKDDLVKFYKVKSEKIKVIHHGYDGPKDPVKRETDRYNIIFIGRLEKRKNIIGIIRAFNMFMERIGETEREISLTLAGKPGFGFEEIQDEMSKSPYRDHIKLPGYISGDEKQELYSKAGVFVFPSLCEGFGMPILEAMSYGVPAIASDIPPLREIAADAAIFADPHDTRQISDAMYEIFCDPDKTEELIRRGRRNLERFSWKKCAEETFGYISDWQ